VPFAAIDRAQYCRAGRLGYKASRISEEFEFMRIVAFERNGEPGVGVLADDGASVNPYDLSPADAEGGVQALADLAALGRPAPPTGDPVAIDGLHLCAPMPRPKRNIFCVGKNYYDHAHEFASSGFDSSAAAGAVPKAPIIFSKVPESVIAHGEPILQDPAVSTATDYEVELGVIIGKGGRGIAKENALDHVWGYTVINDATARDLQGLHSQWLIGKSQDTFCPMGPAAVTADEFNLDDAFVRTWINGELRQDSNTKLLIFDVPTVIATLAAGITLIPGDVIATGTPAGVGIGFDPPKYLEPGDVVRMEIEGIGVLENEIRTHAG
jgi:2-keto-4-pentenoate hydratase/2-oxohepta-3-ene-1,7-dioic acid hydratase in catechol pathway